MKIAFTTNILSPYRRPLLQRLADTPGWQLRVFVDAEREFDREWQVEAGELDVRCTRGLSIPRPVRVPGQGFGQRITLHVPISLYAELEAFRPDVVVSHELGPRSLVAATYARRHGVPLVLWSYQSRVSAEQGRSRNLLRRALLRQATSVIGMGTQAREVLEGWGVAPERIVDAPNAADHESLTRRRCEAGASARVEAIRGQVARGRKLALVPGRLVELKGTTHLLRAWDQLPAVIQDQWQLVFLGSGPLAGTVQRDPHALHVPSVQPREVADWLAAADLHVFPSLGDVWGLVVNEAMHCGAPTLCSRRAGCYEDLIEEGRNGLGWDPMGPDAAKELLAALTHPDLDALGWRARTTVARFSQDRMADGFRAAIARARASACVAA